VESRVEDGQGMSSSGIRYPGHLPLGTTNIFLSSLPSEIAIVFLGFLLRIRWNLHIFFEHFES
jgi:hypothetical protein